MRIVDAVTLAVNAGDDSGWVFALDNVHGQAVLTSRYDTERVSRFFKHVSLKYRFPWNDGDYWKQSYREVKIGTYALAFTEEGYDAKYSWTADSLKRCWTRACEEMM